MDRFWTVWKGKLALRQTSLQQFAESDTRILELLQAGPNQAAKPGMTVRDFSALGLPFCGPNNKECSILESMLGSPFFWGTTM